MMLNVLSIWLMNSLLSGVAYSPVMAIAEQVNSTSSQSARHIPTQEYGQQLLLLANYIFWLKE